MEKLTKRQEDALNYIKTYIVAHGYPPTVREKQNRKHGEDQDEDGRKSQFRGGFLSIDNVCVLHGSVSGFSEVCLVCFQIN